MTQIFTLIKKADTLTIDNILLNYDDGHSSVIKLTLCCSEL